MTASYNLPFTELYFYNLAIKCNYDIQKIVNKLNSPSVNLDGKSLGWWIWDFKKNQEIYSDKFRKTIAATKENFPDVPESWKKAIDPKDLELAKVNLDAHIKTKGVTPYSLTVTYNKLDGSGTVTVICHGVVVKWTDDWQPEIMIGLHFNQYGFLELSEYKSNPLSFEEFRKLQIGEPHQLFQGCMIKVLFSDDKYIKMECEIHKTTVPEHYHPDCTEVFTTLKGVMVDRNTGHVLMNKDVYSVDVNQRHTMSVLNYWKGIIEQYKVVE